MWRWLEIILLIYLFINAKTDIKRKEVSLIISIIFLVLGVIISLVRRKESLLSCLLGMGLGLVIIGISLITKNAIGKGDGLCFIISGLFLGFLNNLSLFIYSTFICGIFSIFLLIFGKKKKKDRLAFMPFVLLSYVIMIGLEVTI